MKKIFTILCIVISGTFAFAQAPSKMTYQVVVRNTSNNLVASSNVGIYVSIYLGPPPGVPIWAETHTTTTNANGLATIQIGSLTPGLENIDWSNGTYYIQTDIDPTGGTSYTISGSTQLITVPYAFYANESEHSAVADSLNVDRVYCYLKKKATLQSIATSTNTTINNYDVVSTSGFTVNSGTGDITFNESGTYTISVQTSFQASTPGRKIVWLNCVSALWTDRIANNEMSGDANRIVTSFVGRFNAGDVISLGVFQATGVTVNCPNNTQVFDETWVNIERLYK